MLRCAMSDFDLETQLAYGRTLAATYDVTHSTMQYTYDMNLSDYITTIYFTNYMHKNTIFKFKMLANIIEYSKQHELI